LFLASYYEACPYFVTLNLDGENAKDWRFEGENRGGNIRGAMIGRIRDQRINVLVLNKKTIPEIFETHNKTHSREVDEKRLRSCFPANSVIMPTKRPLIHSYYSKMVSHKAASTRLAACLPHPASIAEHIISAKNIRMSFLPYAFPV